MSKLKVVVTEKHIEEGEPEEAHSCALALAIGEALNKGVEGDGRLIGVGCNSMTIDFVEEFDLPDEAAAFVKAFDGGKPVEPFEFELELPDWLYNDEG